MPTGIFGILPNNFFSILSGTNREHYAALLVLYYRFFQENTRGLERELVVREFMNYLALHRDTLVDESTMADESANLDETGDTSGDDISDETGGLLFGAKPGAPELAFEAPAGKTVKSDERMLASRFLKRLISTGWLGDETLADFTKVINITAWGKPFMKALTDIDGGLKTEYESHVVTVYSMLCGETIKKDGHHAVLKAHEEFRS